MCVSLFFPPSLSEVHYCVVYMYVHVCEEESISNCTQFSGLHTRSQAFSMD